MRLIYILVFLLFFSCGVQFQYATLNSAGQFDSIYGSSKNVVVETPSNVTFTSFYDFNNGFYLNPYNRWNFYSYNNWVWNNYYYPFGWRNWNRPWFLGYNWNYYDWYYMRINNFRNNVVRNATNRTNRSSLVNNNNVSNRTPNVTSINRTNKIRSSNNIRTRSSINRINTNTSLRSSNIRSVRSYSRGKY